MSALVVLPDEGKSVHFGGTGAIYKLLGEQTKGTLALVEHTVSPRTLAAPTHTHRDEDEALLEHYHLKF